MKTLKERMETALAARSGTSKAGLARACGVSKPSVTGWFSGDTQSLDGGNLIKAAAYLGVRPEWLATGRGAMTTEAQPGSSSYPLYPVEVWDDDTPLDDDEVELPIYKSAEFASGNGTSHQVVVDEGRRLRYGRRTLRKAGVNIASAAGGLNKGRSNEPLILDGAIVMMDKSKTEIVDGEFYGLDQEGEFRVKRLYQLRGGGLRLRSYNQEEFEDEDYGPDWHERISIIGWVWTWEPPIQIWRGR